MLYLANFSFIRWEFILFDGHFYYLVDNSFIWRTIHLIRRKDDEIPFFGGSFNYFGGRIILILFNVGDSKAIYFLFRTLAEVDRGAKLLRQCGLLVPSYS